MDIRDRSNWFITIETLDAKFVKVNLKNGLRGCYLDRRVECGPKGGKVTLWRRENRRGIGYPYTDETPAGVWHKTQYNAIHSNR